MPDPAYCIAIERATGGQVTRADLRPHDFRDIWPEWEPPGHAPPAGNTAAPAQPAPVLAGRMARRGKRRIQEKTR